MSTISNLLKVKGKKVWSIGPERSVFDALKLMAEKNIGALLVVDNDRPVGLISERDYARKVILKGHHSTELKVADIMIRQVVCTQPDESVEECMAIMTERHIRHLPVLEKGKVIGMVSIGDLVKAVIAEQQFVIAQLEHYISG